MPALFLPSLLFFPFPTWKQTTYLAFDQWVYFLTLKECLFLSHQKVSTSLINFSERETLEDNLIIF